jgi:hypothetical protein
MVKRRIGATVSAMIVAMQLGSPLSAEPTVEQLDDIKAMLSENDIAALRTYLKSNPELLDGESQLAALLRQFMLESKHLPNYLSDSPTRDSPGASVGAAEEGSDPGDDGGGDQDDNGSY